MPNVAFENMQDFRRQAVDTQVRSFFENNAPGYNAFEKAVDKKPITDKGYRIPYYSQRPGGHTGFVPSSSDFNAAIPFQSQSMYVYPVSYALPMIWQGNALRATQVDPANALQSRSDILKLYTETATKRINRMFYGDGSGALAFAATTLASTGAGQTLTCTTAAAATAGQTKGGWFLEANHVYQAWNTTTGAVRGTFTVTTASKTAPTVNVTAGSVTSGDPITDVGSYQRYMRGLAWLISDQSRTLQGLATASFPDLNSSVVDLAGATLTPVSMENLKSGINTRNNTEDAERKLLGFITFGQHSVLRKQGYNLGFYMRNEDSGDTMKGVQKRYEDGDTVFVRDADCDDDRVYLAQADEFKMYEEMAFGEYRIDDQEWRMLLGANNTGSDNYQKAMGNRANPGTTLPRASGFIKRASLTSVQTQSS